MSSLGTNYKFIAYKWLTYGPISKNDFIAQFVGRDLFNDKITDIAQLEWRIKGRKLTKDKVLEYLGSVDGKNALIKSKAVNLFEEFRKTIGHNKNITNSDRLLAFLKDNDVWFNLIFK